MNNRLSYLLEQYKSGKCTVAERRELLNFVSAPANERWIKSAIDQEIQYVEEMSLPYPLGLNQEDAQPILAYILQQEESGTKKIVHKVSFLKTVWVRYAAAVILIFGATAYLWTATKKTKQMIVSANKHLLTDIGPGWDRAILTLANGRQIPLDSTQGNVVQQGNLTVINLGGKLSYEGVGAEAEYNTITTPKGGQYQIVLPDGSKVWLNAASSIKFPTAFTGSTRKVEMTGEAYLEVAKNAKKSFMVKANGTEIQVLGTSFNVNAYIDEPTVKITLLSGKVKIDNTILKPGEAYGNGKITVADVEQVMAWKKGIFNLQDADVKTVMRQLERWYDIEVRYEGTISAIHFQGEINRGVRLSTVLNWLSELGVNCRLEGRTLTVSAS